MKTRAPLFHLRRGLRQQAQELRRAQRAALAEQAAHLHTLAQQLVDQTQLLDTPTAQLQPEVLVFFEAATPEASGATLLRLLGLAWGCNSPADVDFYNLENEHELRRIYGDEAPGDAALWVTGSYHGPVFQPEDRVLMLVRPLTLRRLLEARQAAAPLAERQREAARQAEAVAQAQQRQRSRFMADVTQALRSGG